MSSAFFTLSQRHVLLLTTIRIETSTLYLSVNMFVHLDSFG